MTWVFTRVKVKCNVCLARLTDGNSHRHHSEIKSLNSVSSFSAMALLELLEIRQTKNASQDYFSYLTRSEAPFVKTKANKYV